MALFRDRIRAGKTNADRAHINHVTPSSSHGRNGHPLNPSYAVYLLPASCLHLRAAGTAAQYDVLAVMAINVQRVLNLTVFTFFSLVLFLCIILTPADAIYQCYITQRLTNIFIITGGYVVTFILAVLIYTTRIYTNRTVLSGIPKAWIPVEREDVGKSVRRLVKEGLAHSAIIAYQARPRDIAADGHDFSGYESLLVDYDNPPWGQVEHPGWSSPSCPDLPDLPYRTVVQELPHLIEAKAVSLAPPDPIFTATQRALHAPFPETEESIPDTRVVEVLRRPISMGLRGYLQHLTALNVVDPPEIGMEFVALYERARFSTRELHEAEFRTLMHVFAELLRGMKVLDPQILDEVRGGGSSQAESESLIGPSDEEGETDTVDSYGDSEAMSRGRSNSLRPSNASTWDGARQGRWSPVWSRRSEAQRTLAPPRTPSMRSLRRVQSNVSSSSGGSVIRLVETRGRSFFTPTPSATPQDRSPKDSPKPKEENDDDATPSVDTLFPKTDPAIDGEECLHDCASCTVKYPAKFDVDQEDTMYGNINGWSTHVLVATGKADWVRDVADEEGSVMEAIEKGGLVPSNGKLKLSASNMPVPDEYHHHDAGKQPTTVLLLPRFTIVDHVTPQLAPDLIKYFVNRSPTTTTPLVGGNNNDESEQQEQPSTEEQQQQQQQEEEQENIADIQSLTSLRSRPSPHSAVILLCSHRTRDARCGQSAPLLRKEFERHLRHLGLYRDMDDERPGGVGIYFINHVGGHKYAANVIIYRRRDFEWYKKTEGTEEEEGAAQGIWLARVRPQDCENIVRYTVLQGKVVKPGEQLRGGFDRERGVTSW
ncbi:hypothetical protein BO83DRAFT_323187 [Aspergillus eucalypticola CBS 122712]|uniref:Defect at low temperature protein 1 n=1 Tax=Aspergillus eucalypticola (strain CBS 122712 / IBT 29274) TaxID=1448314 RepID=A0A317URI9_ASPEC|nr:uncharacterized protein BO83DRAFT_323187 [Aspergillus eucalypticola CBS 122712]PWY64019.1 hypothetical protein BO83DRAFT_323187 [Aspergillus eucalypticola CBS 122712]